MKNETFNEWLERLKKITPNLNWDLINNWVIDDLRKVFQETRGIDKDKKL